MHRVMYLNRTYLRCLASEFPKIYIMLLFIFIKDCVGYYERCVDDSLKEGD